MRRRGDQPFKLDAGKILLQTSVNDMSMSIINFVAKDN